MNKYFNNNYDYVFGIDVGSSESGYAVLDADYNIINCGKDSNEIVRSKLLTCSIYNTIIVLEDFAVRNIANKYIGETCINLGRYIQLCEDKNINYVKFMPQKYRPYVGGNKDSLVREYLIGLFGSKTLKENNIIGKGATSDVRSALSLCVFYLNNYKIQK